MGEMTEISLPDFGDGESDKFEAIVSFWPVSVGAEVHAGDDLIEIVTDKASFIVPCPITGILREKRVREEDRVHVGDIIAVLEANHNVGDTGHA
jgi:pyruvate/2-oxoglutarate dehydrogenase complex dihydrolipoamide acyltransferase (E2) component